MVSLSLFRRDALLLITFGLSAAFTGSPGFGRFVNCCRIITAEVYGTRVSVGISGRF